MVTSPSTIWAILATPNPASGGVPFIWTDNASPVIDVLQFYWNDILPGLSINCNGDTAGTNQLNVYGQLDAYQPQSVIAAQKVIYGSDFLSQLNPGYTTSSSQGTGLLPSVTLTGDYLGAFSSWGYDLQSAAYQYSPHAMIANYARGSVAGNVGGESHFLTKADGGTLTDRVILDNAGNLYPTTATVGGASSANLGKAGYGWGKVNLNYTIAVAAGAANQTTPAGAVLIAAGASSIVVTNSLVNANSIVLAVLQGVDATLTTLLNVVPTAGSFTIRGNANATGNLKVAYLIINTDN